MMMRKNLLPAGALVLLTLAAYLPALSDGFIWDDDAYLLHNPTVRTADGLRQAWLDPRSTPQYYPLVFTTFWVEYHILGLAPAGYHAVNILLHATSAILVWLVLRRLAMPGAWLAAAIFALHPVHVESVAWITERKNVLSGVFYLAALLAYLKFTGLGSETEVRSRESKTNKKAPASVPTARGWYILCLGLFVCALLSKTVTCSLPAAIVLVLWWKRGAVSRRDWIALAPLFALGLALGLTTAWIEKHHVGAEGDEWSLSPIERCLVAGRALWFYARELAWPVELTFIYPRWQIDASAWWQYLYPAAAIAVIIGLWLARGRLGRGPLVAVLFFAGTLVPALGFINVYPMRYSFVADHFQYLASLGLIALAAGAVAQALARPDPRLALARPALAGALLLALGVLTWQQTRIYQNVETLWTDTLRKNPDCRMAHNNLGTYLARERRYSEAVAHLQAAIRIAPDDPRAHYNLAHAFALLDRLQDAAAEYDTTVRLSPDHALAQVDLGDLLSRAGKFDAAVPHYAEALRINSDLGRARVGLGLAYASRGKLTEAAREFAETLRRDPSNTDARAHEAIALARQGKPDEAVQLLTPELASNPAAAEVYRELADAFAVQGRWAEAADQYRRALHLQATTAAYHFGLGVALAHQGQADAAREEFQEATRDPRWPAAACQAAWTLATYPDTRGRDGALAVRLAQQACAATSRPPPGFLDTLAAAHAEAGQFTEAVASAREAVTLASTAGQPEMAAEIQKRLAGYEQHRPFRQAGR
jgi:tetratricopeptide (TPR) repeat protein